MKHLPAIFARALLCTFFCFVANQLFSQSTVIAYGSVWNYWANTAANEPLATWKDLAFPEVSSWGSGPGQLGYGDGDEATCVPSGGTGADICLPGGNKYITTYFRKVVNIPNPGLFSNFTLNVKRDDGIVLYINGTERYNNNMPAGRTYATLATAAAGDDGNTTQTAALSTAFFTPGDNIIAVEIHQNAASSTDISFDLELLGNDAFSPTLTRGPYLQMGNKTAMTIRWRTSATQNSRIELGTVFGTYPLVFTDAANVTEHTLRATGLSPDTKYYYRIGNSTAMGIADPNKFFTTLPPDNTTRKIRIAAFGDCGKNTGNNSAGVNGVTYQTQSFSQYQAYLTNNGIDAPDAWLLLGDNAYNSGTDLEYTNNFFGTYGTTILKNHKLYPVPGNHDYANSATNQDTHGNCPYYSIFDLPSAGECGGLASGKEEYYSYDIGNIHFLALDAYGEESNKRMYDITSAQAAWVQNDLAANTKKWTVAYFHHPPYTKGSHNSDTEGDLISMRSNFITLLENAGVDLVINGHSHDYERSYLLKGHFGLESSFVLNGAGKHAVSSSSARYTSNAACPYVYNSTPTSHGTVYVVAGSTGASGNVQAGYPHDAFPFSVNDGGFFYFEVEDNRLDAKFIRRDGSVFDNFTIMKDVNKVTNYNVTVNTPVVLNASWPANNYSWNSGATTRSINFTPLATSVTNFTVTDNVGCITDQFSVTATTVLPVSMLNYEVTLTANNKVNVNWSTATESNNRFFNIERSSNGREFTIIGTVNAVGNSTDRHDYLFVDEFPLPGTSFYRLSQTDVDNHKEYLGIKRVVSNEKEFEVKTISTGNGKLMLKINTVNRINGRIRIYDITGRVRKDEMLNLVPGVTMKEFDLSSGIYIWEVSNENGEASFQKVIVQQ